MAHLNDFPIVLQQLPRDLLLELSDGRFGRLNRIQPRLDAGLEGLLRLYPGLRRRFRLKRSGDPGLRVKLHELFVLATEN